MLADQLDYVVGVDPHRDRHALAIVDVRTGGVVFETSVAADTSGYARALDLAKRHAAGRGHSGRRTAPSAGPTRFLSGEGERVLEVGRLRRERRSGGRATRRRGPGRAERARRASRPSHAPAASEKRCVR